MEEVDFVNGHRNLVDDNPFKKGCNPSYSTARSKLQKKRSRINDDIIKELRLRRGAENLLRVATNKEVLEKVRTELGFVNSKLEVLKADLASLNSSVKTYQNENSENSIPMITLGLKETKDANFSAVFMDYIEEHYSEPGSRYEGNIKRLHALRKAVKTPERSEAGIELLMSYLSQLNIVEKRFYPDKRTVHVYFTWYDSLTGNLTTQKTLGYEKGCVLFNIGALYSQIGTAENRNSVAGIDRMVDSYQRSAGMLKYLRDRFSNAPSLDMYPETLTLLIELMLSQGQECLYEKLILSEGKPEKFISLIKCAQEAAMVAQMYDETHNAVATKPIRTDVPPSWITLTIVKANHYRSLAHLYLAKALLLGKDLLPSFTEIQETLQKITYYDTNSTKNHQYGDSTKKQLQYCRAHVKEAINLNETAEKDYNFCRTLRHNDDVFSRVLSSTYAELSALLIDVSDETEYEDIFLSVASIKPEARQVVQVTLPEFNTQNTETDDFFKELGPLAVFSANNEWTSPRTVTLNKHETNGYGFTVKGEQSCVIVEVDDASPAENAGIKANDILVKVNGVDVKWTSQKDIKALIVNSGLSLQLTVTTPLPKTKTPSTSSSQLSPTTETLRSTASSSSGSHDMKQTDSPTGTWKKKVNNNLTFLKNRKQTTPKGSLRKK